MQRNPWWKRHVRPDYLTIKLTDMSASTSWYTHQPCQKYVLQTCTADLHYVEADTDVLLPVAKIGTDDKYGSSLQEGFNWPRYLK